MSKKFLHLDRSGLVEQDTVFERDFVNTHPAGPTDKLENDGIYDQISSDDYDYFKQFYPEGLTSHGKNYLYRYFELTKIAHNNQDGFLNSENIARLYIDEKAVPQIWLTEMIFELIRRREYSKQPSRFQSVFAAQNRDELDQWRNLSAVNAESGDIYSVSSVNSYKFDSSLLNLGSFEGKYRGFGDMVKKSARDYWSEKTSDTPVYEVLLEPPVEVEEPVDST